MWRAERSEWVLLVGAAEVSFGLPGDEPQVVALGRSASLGEVCACAREAVRLAGPGAHRPGALLRVVVSDRWLGVASLPWSPDLKDRTQAEMFGRSQLEAAGQASAVGDRLVIDDAGYRAPRAVFAYPGALVELAQALASEHRLRLTAIDALPVVAASAVRVRSAAIAIVEDGWIRLWRASGTRLLPVGAGRPSWPDGNPPSEALLMWSRARMRDPTLPEHANLEVCDLRRASGGAAWPVGASPASPSASRPTSAWGWIGPAARENALSVNMPRAGSAGAWTMAAAAGVLAVVSVGAAVQRQADVREREVALAVSTARAPMLRRAPPDRAQAARAAAVDLAIRELNLPFAELLRSLQTPRDLRVGLLGIDVTAHGSPSGQMSVVKLTAETPSGQEMTRYIDWLGDRKLFEGVSLVSHEVVETEGRHAYRFNVEATWRE